jgi:hypothetical protein
LTRAGALALFVAGALLSSSVRAEEKAGGEADEKRFWIPGAFLSVETRSAVDVLAAISDMIDTVKPGTGAAFRTLLAKGLEIGGADALDLIGGRRPAGFLLLNPRRHEGSFVLAVGDEGLQSIFRAIGRAMNQEIEDDLIDFGDFVIGEDDTVLYFQHSAPWLLCSLAPEPLDTAARAIREGHAPRAPVRRAHVAVHLDMNELRAAYGDIVMGAFVTARTALSVVAMQPPGPGNPLGPMGIGIAKESVSAGEAIFQGFDEIDLAIRISDDAAEIEASAVPTKKSAFAPLVRVVEPVTFFPATALPEGGTFVTAWRADPTAMKLLNDAFARAAVRVITKTDTLDENNDETKEKIAHYRRLIAGFLSGEGAASVAMGPDGINTVVAMDTSFEIVRDLYGEITDIITNELSPLLQNAGLGMKQTYRKNVRKLADGGRVDRATITYEFGGMAAEQTRVMFNFMFGGNEQVTEIGDTGAGTIMGMGRDGPDKILDDAVARQLGAADFEGVAWPSASKELVSALEEARGVTIGAFEARVGGYLAMILSMMKAQPGIGAFLQLEDEEIADLVEKDVPIVGWVGVEKGKLLCHQRIPMAGVKNIVDFIQKMQQRMMGGRRGGEWDEPAIPDEDPVEVW